MPDRAAGQPEPDLERVADLLVRCSAIPLATIASVLGFSELEGFSRWFGDSVGEHPESARAAGETLAGVVPAHLEADGPDEQLLHDLRRILFSESDRRSMASLVRALRHG